MLYITVQNQNTLPICKDVLGTGIIYICGLIGTTLSGNIVSVWNIMSISNGYNITGQSCMIPGIIIMMQRIQDKR